MQKETNFESMVFYKNWKDIIKALPMEQGYALMMALLDYGLDMQEPVSDDELVIAIFNNCKIAIDSNIEKRISGKKGGMSNKSPQEKKTENREKTAEKSKNSEKQVDEAIEKYCDSQEECKEEIKSSLIEYKDFRKDIGSPLTCHSLKKILQKLDEITGNQARFKAKTIDQSIRNNWKELYPLTVNEVYQVSNNNKALHDT